MSATSEPGRVSDWDDTGPLPSYSGDSKVEATFHDGGPIRPATALPATLTASGGEMAPVATPGPAGASEALVQQIAEAIGRVLKCKPYVGPWNAFNRPVCDRHGDEMWTEAGCPVSVEAARAVASLVEAQVAPLRETVARLNRRAQIVEAAVNELATGTGKGKSRPVAAEMWARCQTTHERGCPRALAAESALRQVRELHVPWYVVNGVRHDHLVHVTGSEHLPADHVCRIGTEWDCEIDPEDSGWSTHAVLACYECRCPTEDGDAGYLLWPCKTARLARVGAADTHCTRHERFEDWCGDCQTAKDNLLRATTNPEDLGAADTQPEGAGVGGAYVPDLSADFAPGGDWHNAIPAPTAGGKVDTAPEAHRPQVGFSDEPTMCSCGSTWFECQSRHHSSEGGAGR